MLETDRLIVRDLEPTDAEKCHSMYCDPEVVRFLRWQAPPLEEYRALFLDRLEAREAYPAGLGVWAAIEKESARLAGILMLKPLEEGPEIEVGYHLARWAWGRGFATEGARALLAHGFDTVGLSRIVAVVDPENHGSLRVIERL